ncbi:MAG: UDP-glucose dehydrogenase family protein [Thermaurantimonas sp.]
MKISVVGTGYVGLVTGTCLAEVGMEVTCVDVNKEKIEGLKNGVMPIFEPGLEEMVIRNYRRERLLFTTKLAESIDGAEVVFIAVGTPPGEDGSADLKYVLAVADEIGCTMKDYLVIVTKSTVPVGTAKRVKKAVADALASRGVDIPFDVASNPEFLKEGAAIEDFMRPDRIVVGTESDRAQEILSKLYKPFTLNGHPVIFMDIPSAEMTKYAANAMLATRISFMNDIANLCELTGADINMVRKGIGTDPRIGPKFLYSGIGYGGSCFPKDVKALIKTGKELGYKLKILEAVEEINEAQKEKMFEKIIKHFNGAIEGKKFALWGLSFKPNTDDMREAPSLVLIEKLLKHGAQVSAYDPVAMNEAKKHYLGDSIEYAKDEYEALTDADAMILVTEWTAFRAPSFKVIKKLLKEPVIFDGRNIYDRRELREQGFTYYGIGVV